VAELLALKNEIQELRNMLTNTVEQIKMEIASIHTTPMMAMETDDVNYTDTTHHHQSTLDIPAIIANLKHDIANVALKTHTMYQKHTTLLLQHQPKYSSVT